jgi:hypothetical protein
VALYYSKGPAWSYGSWIYNYLCNRCLSPLTRIRIPLRRGVLDTTLCNKVWPWLAAGRWFSPGIQVSSNNKTDRHHITEMLLKVTLNTIFQYTIQNNTCHLKVSFISVWISILQVSAHFVDFVAWILVLLIWSFS